MYVMGILMRTEGQDGAGLAALKRLADEMLEGGCHEVIAVQRAFRAGRDATRNAAVGSGEANPGLRVLRYTDAWANTCSPLRFGLWEASCQGADAAVLSLDRSVAPARQAISKLVRTWQRTRAPCVLSGDAEYECERPLLVSRVLFRPLSELAPHDVPSKVLSRVPGSRV
jgi:hypothetical protein